MGLRWSFRGAVECGFVEEMVVVAVVVLVVPWVM